MDPTLLSTRQLAKRWGVSERWLWRATHEVKPGIPVLRLMGLKRYRLADIERIEKEGQHVTRGE
ncbi:DNA-binding protein [Bremerella cremea]|uniref:Terminase n=1 Tax=Blastopirellula marina TaxID=124 RepID=A0A2S8FZG8_9BACT|nr:MULTISPECIES: terminase [Pirellulaceae]PQO37589.1 terminase [Blastopirellula marina]RCS49976.1 DNA-binding protein [Bremerella cremea]